MQGGIHSCIPDSHLYRVTNNKCHIGTVFSPDNGHIVAPKYEEKSNKHIKKICAPSWFYLQGYTKTHGQQDIKNLNHIQDVFF